MKLKTNYKFSASPPLSVMFGFGAKEVILEKTTDSPYVTDMSVISNIYYIVIFSNHKSWGKQMLSIPAERKFDDNIAKTFTNIQYMPVRTRSFEIVKVFFRGDTAKPVPLVITIYFKKHSYFTRRLILTQTVECVILLLFFSGSHERIAFLSYNDPVTSKMFCGVFPSNKLPQTVIKYPCRFVANTNPSDKPGTHWVAFYFLTEEKG